ncbi:Vacuolar amino acid transporter 3 [Alternaria arborescens]|uniref:Vacuolar amino acid transporter 3 n=1 Tax=Alternaria arborescens TaxID=156630 RepID=A0A4Q4SGT2_9PLEO|nr:Vacuolar amino acid transporter 3 [Alternaria arborescens]RYN40916.1 Vacuolar amino acid transporter 3 [Alternaria arborescens]RYO21990.1 Vacuolar amino acid transporter 3 [Alternaria arborescens]RYO69787.1 Vacuolar amino acid transporter 3 [Alternaria arborescens]
MPGERSASTNPQAVPSSRDSGGSSPSQSVRAGSIARLGSPIPSLPSGTPAVRQIPTPSQTANSSSIQTPLPGRADPQSSLPGPSESNLSSALKESLGNSPPRFGPPPIRPLSPAQEAPPRVPPSDYGSFDGRGRSPVPYEDAEIVRRHLVGHYASPSRSNRGHIGEDDAQSTGMRPEEDEEQFSSLQLQGGDITRQIYRWSEQQQAEEQGKLQRSKSFHGSRRRPEDEALDIDSIRQPGGFRRNYLRRAADSPSPGPGPSGYGTVRQPRQPPQVFTSNFLEFLTLYGHFAGESLEEDDEVLGPDEYFSSDALDSGAQSEDEDREYGESSALLTPGKRRKRKAKKTGTGSPTGAAMLLLKSFVGTGVLFLPRAFLNGGMAFSNLVLLAVAGLSYACFVLLVSTRLVVEHSFGDMGFHLYGNWMRNMINSSLVVSQIGFSSAYIVFVSENLQAFVLAVSNCKTFIDIKYMIMMQMVIFLPLSLYRNINNIQKLALVADLFILMGLVYLYYYDLFTIVDQGGISDIVNFNAKDWTLFIGTAIFTFEGIGLIIPIQTGMKDPKKFPKVLGGVMIIITVIFLSAGALSYAAFGSKTKTVVLLNMPQDNKFVNGVQFIYSLAILLSTPLQIYPAIEITSQQLFSRTGKYNPYVKWKKNFFRFFVVLVCACLAWAGAGDLDKFVSLVGSFACIPLVFIYPPLLHYRAVARTTTARVLDVTLCIIGAVGMVYTTTLTIQSWIHGGGPKAPGYCDGR